MTIDRAKVEHGARLAAEATPGPWRRGGNVVTDEFDIVALKSPTKIRHVIARMTQHGDQDAAYIAHWNPEFAAELTRELQRLWQVEEAAREFVGTLSYDSRSTDEHQRKGAALKRALDERPLGHKNTEAARLQEIHEAVAAQALRQLLDWEHFHEVAMHDPFEAEHEAQGYAKSVIAALVNPAATEGLSEDEFRERFKGDMRGFNFANPAAEEALREGIARRMKGR